MKKIVCDFCGEKIELKEGELFLLEIQKITILQRYPDSYDGDYLMGKDLCKNCFNKIKKELTKLKKNEPNNKKSNSRT